MKNFKNYTPEKYAGNDFQEIEEGIYKTKSPYKIRLSENQEIFVTSLTFEFEPERYGEEDASPQDIPQTPFVGFLYDFSVFVTDFYDELNESCETICYQEFGSTDLKDIQKLRTLIGKRFYAVSYTGKHGEEYYNMVIE